MFGVLDVIYTGVRRSPFYRDQSTNYERSIEFFNGNESWYCYVPRSVSQNSNIRRGIIPQNGKVTVYSMSAPLIMTPSIEQTLENLNAIYNDAKTRIEEDLLNFREINIMGISLGNVLAIRTVKEVIEGKVNTLASFVGGGRLGLCAWDSILTGHTAKRSGCKSASDYEAMLEEFSPLNYLQDIEVKSLFARFGTSDLLIPYYPHGEELHDSLKALKTERNDIKVYKHADHVSALYFASRERLNEKF